jgi:hypothetical protein
VHIEPFHVQYFELYNVVERIESCRFIDNIVDSTASLDVIRGNEVSPFHSNCVYISPRSNHPCSARWQDFMNVLLVSKQRSKMFLRS